MISPRLRALVLGSIVFVVAFVEVGCRRRHRVHAFTASRPAGAVVASRSAPGSASPFSPIATRTVAVTDDYFGTTVADPYRWLEDADAADVKAWTAAQDERTRAIVAASPLRSAIHDRLDALLTVGTLGASALRQRAGGVSRLFFAKREGHQSQPILYWRDGAHGVDHVAFDAANPAFNADSPEASEAREVRATRSLDWWFPSDDGALLAYGSSTGGDEQSVLRVRDVATGRDLDDRIAHAPLASIAWLPDGQGFFYTRVPALGEVPKGEERYHRSVYFHRLHGDAKADRLVWPPVGSPRPMTDFPSVDVTPSGRFVVVRASQGWARSSVFIQEIQPNGDPLKGAPMRTLVDALTMKDDATYDPLAHRLPRVDGAPGRDVVYVRTNERAPNFKIMAFDPASPAREGWREVVAQGADPIREFDAVGDSLFVSYLHRAHARLERRDLDGTLKGEVAVPPLSSASVPHGARDGTEAIFSVESYVDAPSLRRLDLASATVGAHDDVLVRIESQVAASDYEVEQLEATSRDGARVTAFVVHKKGLRKTGQNPTLLYGYGGFSISQVPTFIRAPWTLLERGGVYVVANLRGGAEYGEAWHHAGMGAQKQHTFDDAIAVAEALIARGFTSPKKLAILGGSNGGLLVGALITQRPELFRVAVASVPLTDMLRYDRFLVGKLWVPEYGSATDPAQFATLFAYSPYHHVVDGTRYPAVMITTGEGDSRVDPLHAKKLAARLQHATTSGEPVLLRVESRAGHGAGKPRATVLEEQADQYTFMVEALGVAGAQTSPPRPPSPSPSN